jgi:release factor H-coupled RctB family protein
MRVNILLYNFIAIAITHNFEIRKNKDMGNFDNFPEVITKIIASEKNWIETLAVEQLQSVSKLEGMELAVGLPDLHPGKTYPIGAAFICRKWIYPQLVGNDIGCGMGLWETDLNSRKLKLDKWEKQLDDLDSEWNGDHAAWLGKFGLNSTSFDAALGTIGGGNHFVELQKIERVIDRSEFESLKLDNKRLFLLVHSGSRGLGQSILNSCGKDGLEEQSSEAKDYINKHDLAVRWAEANRALIAERFLTCLKSKSRQILDVKHNTVFPIQIEDSLRWLHRKGATPSDQGFVIIPGSRGALSYLVKPIGEQKNNAYSLAHGAGRKWNRTSTKARLAKYHISDFTRTKWGSRIICEDKNLIFEEAPQAYKNIDNVVGDLVDAGLIKIIAILSPVLTYKTRRME